jgi:hypothetical protein
MPYSNAAAVHRPDIKTFLEQAREAETGLIAEKVLGIYPSETQTGRYPRYKIEKGELLKTELETERAPHSAYKRVNRSWEWSTYDCVDRGLEGAVDDTEQAEMAKFFDVEVKEAKLVRRNVALSYERRVANLVMSEANSGFTAVNSVAAYTEAGLANIDIARDVQDAKRYLEARGVNPDDVSIVLARQVWDRLRRSPKLLSYTFGNNANVGNVKLSLTAAADALEVKEIIVSGRHYDAGKKGGGASLTAIWGTSTVLIANLAAGDFNNGGIGRTITWTEDGDGLYTAETYRNETTREDIVRVRQNTGEHIIDTNEGYLINTQWG